MSTLVSIFTSFIDALYSLTNAINFPSYALAIIILGLIVRLILLPLTIMQMKSMLGMTEIQPELQRLQKQYANNREKLSEEMMKLYQEYNVKPAAGCLPILIQLPILYILFWAIRDYNLPTAPTPISSGSPASITQTQPTSCRSYSASSCSSSRRSP